jgi:hypothetical protein
VGHLVGKYDLELNADRLVVRGSLGWAKQKGMTSFNLIVLRLIMLCGGKFFPNLVRKLLQKLLITGKTTAPYRFERVLRWAGGQLNVQDEITPAINWAGVQTAGVGASQTSIYVVMSRTFQAGQMQRWHDLTPDLMKLAVAQPLRVERSF